jgi:tripartite-type tricarboxylate transporter receptor subunit TctC
MQAIAAVAAGLLALLIAGSPAAQSNYPEKAIHLVIGFPAGSQVDSVARLLGQKLTEALGKQTVVDNITGAAGNIAAERVAKAAADGYTLILLAQGTLVVGPSLYKLTYDPAKDFAPISQLTESPNILVVNIAVPAKSVRELVALAKAQSGVLTYASGGNGQAGHMTAELFKSVAGIDIRHIPYKGVVAAMPDLLGGRITMTFSNMAVVLPMMREGRLRALAVTSLKRSPAAPEILTMVEAGYPGFEATQWYGLLAPAVTPPIIVRKVYLETVKALALPDVRARFADLGLDIVASSPDELAAVIKTETQMWAKVIKDANIKPD